MPDTITQAAGPGAIADQGVSPKPQLDGATEYEYVTILNPLSVDFVGLVGVSRPVNMPFQVRTDGTTSPLTTNESDVSRNYGLSLKNKDHPSHISIVNRVSIPSGKTINLLGSEAQVICRQLVNEIMQLEGRSLMLADAFARSEIEKRIIISRRSVNDILGQGPVTISDQVRNAVDNTNPKESVEEVEFPTITVGNKPSLKAAVSNVAANLRGSSPTGF